MKICISKRVKGEVQLVVSIFQLYSNLMLTFNFCNRILYGIKVLGNIVRLMETALRFIRDEIHSFVIPPENMDKNVFNNVSI